jgi:hypothetical protein
VCVSMTWRAMTAASYQVRAAHVNRLTAAASATAAAAAAALNARLEHRRDTVGILPHRHSGGSLTTSTRAEIGA